MACTCTLTTTCESAAELLLKLQSTSDALRCGGERCANRANIDNAAPWLFSSRLSWKRTWRRAIMEECGDESVEMEMALECDALWPVTLHCPSITEL